MIEAPAYIRKRPFRTHLASQWWRVFNYLGVRCPALRSVETGLWWSDVDFLLPTLRIVIVTAECDDEIEDEVVDRYRGQLLILGPIPDPEAQGEWFWKAPGMAQTDADAPYVSLRGIARTGRLFAGQRLPTSNGDVALTRPRLDTSLTPDLEVRRAFWVARRGATNRTGHRKQFGDETLSDPSFPRTSTPPVVIAGADAALVEPDPANYPPTGPRVLVYQHFDADGVLVYIGISDQPIRRGKTHALYSPWIEFAEDMTGKWCNSRAEAEAVEEYLIRTRHPIFNTRHNHGAEARMRRTAYLAAKNRLDLLGAAAA